MTTASTARIREDRMAPWNAVARAVTPALAATAASKKSGQANGDVDPSSIHCMPSLQRTMMESTIRSAAASANQRFRNPAIEQAMSAARTGTAERYKMDETKGVAVEAGKSS